LRHTLVIHCMYHVCMYVWCMIQIIHKSWLIPWSMHNQNCYMFVLYDVNFCWCVLMYEMILLVHHMFESCVYVQFCRCVWMYKMILFVFDYYMFESCVCPILSMCLNVKNIFIILDRQTHTYIHIHTHILTCLHTYIHTHTNIHTYIHTCIHAYRHPYTLFEEPAMIKKPPDWQHC
jgi:hypothetical protein